MQWWHSNGVVLGAILANLIGLEERRVNMVIGNILLLIVLDVLIENN